MWVVWTWMLPKCKTLAIFLLPGSQHTIRVGFGMHVMCQFQLMDAIHKRYRRTDKRHARSISAICYVCVCRANKTLYWNLSTFVSLLLTRTYLRTILVVLLELSVWLCACMFAESDVWTSLNEVWPRFVVLVHIGTMQVKVERNGQRLNFTITQDENIAKVASATTTWVFPVSQSINVLIQ